MNKKVIIGLIVGVIALALVVVAILGVAKGWKFNNVNTDSDVSVIESTISTTAETESEETTSATSSSTGSTASGTTSQLPQNGTKADCDNSSPVVAGKIVSVPIKVTKNPGSVVALLEFSYDTDNLSLIDFENGEIFDGVTASTVDNTAKFILMNDSIEENDTGTGTVLNLIFRVKDDAKAGTYEIKYNTSSAQWANIDEEFVTDSVVVESGSITIK